MTISQAFARYDLEELYYKGKAEKTRLNYRGTLKSFVSTNGDIEVKYIFYDHVVRWKQYMFGRGQALSTVSHQLSHLRNVLKYLRKRGIDCLDPELLELPKVPRKEVVFLDYSEVQHLIDTAATARDKAIIACLFSTGCRISELLNLNRDDLRDGEAMVTGKGEKRRPVYFDPTALGYLNAYLETRQDNLKPLFISGQYRRITPGRVNQLLHQIVNQTDIEKRVTPHTLRHSFATDFLTNGADIRATQEILGHQNVNSTMVYTHVTDKHKRESFKKYHTAQRTH